MNAEAILGMLTPVTYFIHARHRGHLARSRVSEDPLVEARRLRLSRGDRSGSGS